MNISSCSLCKETGETCMECSSSISYQCREIGESNWQDCSFEWYEQCSTSPHMDTRVKPAKTKVELLLEVQAMSDKEEIVELCKIALHLGGPQNLSAVGIGRYLRLVNPDFVIALISQLDQQRSCISSLREDLQEAIAIDCDDDARDAIAEIERTGTPGSVIREMNDELVCLRTDAERFQFIAQDAESSLERIYGDNWLGVVDQLIGMGKSHE